MRLLTWLGAVLFACASAVSAAGVASATVEIDLDPSKARAEEVPADFAGLSLEMQAVRAAFNTPKGHWLSAANTPFVTMLKTLGVRSLRIGGNTTERNAPDGGRPAKPYPSDADATHVGDFVNAIGGNLIWNLPVAARFDPTSYSDYAARMLEDQAQKGYTFKTVFQLGNEPDLFKVSLEEYPSRFEAYSQALDAALGERALYCGPSAAGATAYAKWLAGEPKYREAARHARIAYVTQHWYPFGGANAFPNVEAAIAAMLAPAETRYARHYANWAAPARQGGFRPRFDETNSMYNGGFEGASDSFAAALWALDYLSYFSHETELAGINFHNAGTAVYNSFAPARLAPTYSLQGVGYGLLAFAQHGQGRPVPRTIRNPKSVTLTAYALLHADGTETLRIINKTHGAASVDTTVVVDPGKRFERAEVMYLAVAGADAAAKTGITLGGRALEGDGTWAGGFTLPLKARKGRFPVSVPPTQAAIVRFY
jgi:hypothetical protein